MHPPKPSNPALAFQRVSFVPPGGQEVFSEVTWRVAAGSTVFVAGDSGSGKSTLLRMGNRLLEPSSGSIECDGRTVNDWPIGALRKHAVYVPQRPTSLANNVGDDLRSALDWQGLPHSERSLHAALAVAGLEQMDLSRGTLGLSEGEQGRLGVARALLLEPPILMLDEPTAALDPRTAARLLSNLERWASKANRTLIVVTHRLDEPVQLAADTVFLLDKRLVGPFSSDALQTRTLPEAVSRFCDATGDRS